MIQIGSNVVQLLGVRWYGPVRSGCQCYDVVESVNPKLRALQAWVLLLERLVFQGMPKVPSDRKSESLCW